MAATNIKTLFRKYLKDLSDVALRGDAREESFYPALADLFHEVSETTGSSHVHVTTLPKPTDAGNPHVRFEEGEGTTPLPTLPVIYGKKWCCRNVTYPKNSNLWSSQESNNSSKMTKFFFKLYIYIN